MKTKNYPWVLRLSISIRKDWFSYWWKTRGSNYLEMQIWIFRINIGMPWLPYVLEGKIRDYGSLDDARRTNDSFIKNGIGVLIGKYPDSL